MYGYNIQSSFFEDSVGNVWFTTYEALHYYDPRIDDLDYLFMISSKGDTIKQNYKAFYQDGPLLFLKAGEGVFIYDMYEKNTKNYYAINLTSFYQLSVIKQNVTYILLASNETGYKVFSLSPNNQTKILDQGNEIVYALSEMHSNQWWIGHSIGNLSLYDPSVLDWRFNYFVSQSYITGITSLSNDKLLISTSDSELLTFDLITRSIINRTQPISAIAKERIKSPINLYIDRDSTLWIGGEGQGVFFCNLNKKKFAHYLSSAPGETTTSVTKIIERKDGSFLALTRLKGIIHFNKKGEILNRWNELPNGESQFTAFRGTMIDDNHLLFSSKENLYDLDIHNGKISAYIVKSDKKMRFEQIEKLNNGKIIASCNEDLLQEIHIQYLNIYFSPYGDLENRSKVTTYFKTDKQNKLYISNDEVTILVLKPSFDGSKHEFEYSIPIAGGVWSLLDDPYHNSIYISNTQGLFHINSSSQKFRRVLDKKKHLAQTIYSLLQDSNGNLWMGTNKGLIKYFPANEEVKLFSLMDGIQSLEYNSHAYIISQDGHMLFGGINGINYFRPENVALSEFIAPVFLTECLINDEPDSTYNIPQYLDSLVLPFGKNTVSFEFHAVDYSDPTATSVKYKMIGIDNDYVEAKDPNGFARYANLDPGQYTFSILGANSDGIWNKEPREIKISIKPPYWQTWWFISLSIITAASIIYWMFRSYYKRKLEKQNQLLREQSLIIEKQQAVENERTRIASEMHDDLGSGLTTIRYLSDKALQQAKDATEAAQIQRIADHSNTLVRNMSEIIWAMNSRFDNTDNLIGYLRRYASEYLDERQMPFKFESEENDENISIGGEKRRNIFLVFKELLHNSVKYSNAESIRIVIETGDDFVIKISELGGKGFNPDESIEKGNGLFNCQKRLKSIDGKLSFEKTGDAMNIFISVPIKPNSLA